MHLRPRVRLQLSDEVVFGPGKAELLRLIAETGSISAAARQMGMSYRRAWQLVEVMNRCFEVPLVETLQGGKGGGGAKVSAAGEEVLRLFASLEQRLVGADELSRLDEMLAPASSYSSKE